MTEDAEAARPASPTRVEAVERALSLLQCFREAGESLSLAQLAQRSALSKSTILRLAGTLVANGFLHRDGGGRFLLGPELARLGGLARPAVGLAELIRPVLRDLAEAAGETSSFYERDGDMRVCCFRHNAERAARHHLEEGSRHPLDRGAAGLVISAFTGVAGEKAQQVRRQGWAISIGDRSPELAAVAVPLTTMDGKLLGALTVSGLVGRFTPERIEQSRQALLAAAIALRPRLPNAPDHLAPPRP
jgi:DNA-binding IclR family transcriptional regulator